MVVPFLTVAPEPGPEPILVAPAAEPVPAPRWAAKVTPANGPRRQASLFDAPRPVAEAEGRPAQEDRSWRKAVGGKPKQLSLF